MSLKTKNYKLESNVYSLNNDDYDDDDDDNKITLNMYTLPKVWITF